MTRVATIPVYVIETENGNTSETDVQILTDISAQKRLKLAGSLSLQSTVRFGSGAGPRLIRVCRKR